MGVCFCESSKKHQNIIEPGLKKNNGPAYIKCTYDIKDYNFTQILNYRGEKTINKEIESKIKILNGNTKEPLVFKKKFNKIGMNTIIFIVEEKLVNMSYLFNKCKSLKKVEFFSFETIQCTNMRAMFQLCEELEYLDLSNFITSNVTDMGWMFYGCNKLKEIKGINKFITNKVTIMNSMFLECKEFKYLDLSN